MDEKTETVENKSLEVQKEIDELDEQEVKDETNSQLNDSLNMDKEKIIEQLKRTKNVQKRVELFSKWTDKYGLEAVISLVPWIWDLTPAVVSTCYLLAEWINIWLPRADCLKILWYQSVDFFFGSIPVIWDVADFFFKSNRYSAEVFEKHLEKLKKAALEKWVSQKEIDNLWKNEEKFIKTMDKYITYKDKKKKKSDSKKEA